MRTELQVGDRVRFRGDYLRRIAEHGSYLASWVGTVRGVTGRSVVVHWDCSPALPCPGRPADLERVSR
jgi:hypothetical protein